MDRALRWILVGSFVATIGALGVVSAFFGFDRQDTFEITAVSIVWLTLIVAGPLIAVAFGRATVTESRAAGSHAAGYTSRPTPEGAPR